MSPWLSDLLLRTQTDERLVALARLGNQRAFEAIVDRYQQPLGAYARRINPERAEDLVQQTLLSAFSALQADAEVRHLRAWLYQILRHLAWRESAASPAMSELEDVVAVSESAAQVAERRMLAVETLGALADLPVGQHNALLQTAVHGRSRSEVADLMGLSEGAIRQLVHRARNTVRTAVTAITPLPLLRWLSNPRTGSAIGLSETTLGAGAASGAGIGLKLGVGAIVASGVLAGGVISGVTLHAGAGHGRSHARGRAAVQSAQGTRTPSQAGRAGGVRLASVSAPLRDSHPGRSRGLPASARHGVAGAPAGRSVRGYGFAWSAPRGRGGSGGSGRGSVGGSSGPGSGQGSGPGSGSGSGSDGGSSQGSHGGSGSGSSGSGSGSGGGGGSDSHGGSGSGSGTSSGGGDGGSGSTSGIGGGGGSGGSGGSDGGSSGSGSGGPTAGTSGDGGGGSTSGSTSGSDGGSGSTSGSGDGGSVNGTTSSGSGSSDGSTSGSGDGQNTSGGGSGGGGG